MAMWALIQENSIVLGPRTWNRWVFEGWIQDELGITFSLPQLDPTDSIIINDTVKIVGANIPDPPEMNSHTQQPAGPFLTYDGVSVTGYYTIADQDLAAAKNNLLSQLASNRYNREISGCTVTVQGNSVTIETDRINRQIWNNMLTAGLNNVVYKFSHTLWLTLTTSDIQNIAAALIAKVQGDFDWEQSVTNQILAAQDVATLNAIDIGDPIPATTGP